MWQMQHSKAPPPDCRGFWSMKDPHQVLKFQHTGVLHSGRRQVLRGGGCAGGLGAVFRTVLETMRTLFVWLVDLLLFYTPLGLGKLGESWSNWSFLQAAG